MKTLHELYEKIKQQEKERGRDISVESEEESLDCLLHPKRHAPVIQTGKCVSCGDDASCSQSCEFGAIERENGKIRIVTDRCVGCGECVRACKVGNLKENREIYPVLEALSKPDAKVYALIAPAFVGQLGEEATAGRLRSAFKALGFYGMVEVAVFADILTLKEALEFDRHVQKEGDFQLTSCCCPVWIAMIRNIYKELIPHMPAAVSPMVAAGRVVKTLHPDAVTVFIGPCMAKKKEAREPDIADAVDYVLTFQEVEELFDAVELSAKDYEEDDKEHSSKAGRMYAAATGVAQAVKEAVEQLNADRFVKVNAECADGVKECKQMIEKIKNGDITANFYEGMGCIGGCVGGPKRILDVQEGQKQVEKYCSQAKYKTPMENPYVIELLHRLGFADIDDFLNNSELLVRNFS